MHKTSHLVLVLDCNPVHWRSKVSKRTRSSGSTSSFRMDDEDELENGASEDTSYLTGPNCKQFNQLLNQVHLYASTFLMFSKSNRISLLMTLGPDLG